MRYQAGMHALAIGELKLHMYGKATPRPGRKMGHLTAMAPSPEEAKALVLRARDRLGSGLKAQPR